MNPMKIPNILSLLSFSFLKISKIMTTLMIGVSAFIIPARIEETRSCANANNTPGITLSKIPINHRCNSTTGSRGIRIPLNIATHQSARAPSRQRRKAIPTGVRKVSVFSMKRKEEPHTIPRAIYEGSHPRRVRFVPVVTLTPSVPHFLPVMEYYGQELASPNHKIEESWNL